jgi:hypothetical protein
MTGIQLIQPSPNGNFWVCLTMSYVLEIRIAHSDHVAASLDLRKALDCDMRDIQLNWCATFHGQF